MNELIAITELNGKKVVSARDLYIFLEVKTDFADWCKRMFEYGFVDGVDYSLLKIGERSAHNKKDYALLVDTAKEISMLQRSEKGKQARQYFIECEKRIAKPMSIEEMIIAQAQSVIESKARLNALEDKVATLEAKNTTSPNDYFAVAGYASLIHIPIDVKTAAELGRKASSMCKDLGYSTYSMPDPRFGSVKLYPKEILKTVFENKNL